MTKNFALIESAKTPKAKIGILSDFLRKVLQIKSHDDLTALLSLCANELSGSQERIIKVTIAQGCGITQTEIVKRKDKLGDFASVAEDEMKKHPKFAQVNGLTMHHVFEQMKSIASISRAHDQESKKMAIALPLFRRLKHTLEYRYFIRILDGNNCIGIDREMAFEALAKAYVTHKPWSLVLANIKMYYKQRKSIAHVCKSLVIDGIVDFEV